MKEQCSTEVTIYLFVFTFYWKGNQQDCSIRIADPSENAKWYHFCATYSLSLSISFSFKIIKILENLSSLANLGVKTSKEIIFYKPWNFESI